MPRRWGSSRLRPSWSSPSPWSRTIRPGEHRKPCSQPSVNVEVVLADGTILEDPAGLILPDGAVITVGSGGSARIGGADLGPGDVATVRDGRLDISHPPEGLVQSPVGTAPSAQPTAHGAGSSGPTPTPAYATDPGGTPPPRSATPLPTRAASTASPTSGATAAATPSPPPVIRRPRLRVRVLDGRRLAITWTATERAGSYVLIATRSRSGPARDPVYPGSRVLGEFTEPPPTPLRYRVPDGVVEVRLQVIALRPNGTVLRRSVIVTLAVPLPAGSGSSGGTIETAPDTTPTPVPSPVSPGDASPVPDSTTAAPGASVAAP